MSATGAKVEKRLPTDGTTRPTLELFMRQLAEISPRPGAPISPNSDLIDDLGFDSPAFSRLASLLYEQYGVGGLSTASMRSVGNLTVEGFFRGCVLDVLSFELDEPTRRYKSPPTRGPGTSK